MMPTEDRRVRKTKKAMTKALAQLLLEKPLASISVREIAELADINRGTFYLHYHDVYDMVEKLQNEIFDQFNEIVDRYEPRDGTDELFPLLVAQFQFLSENAELAKALIGKNGDAAFVDKLKVIIREKCFVNVKKILKIKNECEFDYFYHFIVSGCIGICSAWLFGGRKESPAEMAALIENLIVNGAAVLK